MKISLVFLLLSLVLFVNSNDIRDLEPKAFWRPFYDISQIPHCSKKEGRLREDYVKKFAQHFNYKYRQDSYGNAVVEVPARPGKEGKPKLVLQSHLDMVCEKNRGSTHDFDKDPLQLLFSPQDRDWIIANETTLGADDAAGMALSIGLTTDPLAIHGPLELLFTVEEEIGLVGATNLQPGDFVTGTILINIDSGTQGQLTIGCAGGMRVEMDYQEKTTAIRPGQVIYEIYVKGLVGGHSGKDIDAGKGNSIKILGRILNAIVDSNIDFNIVNLSAGTSSNAIPRDSSAQIAIVEGDAQRVASIVAKLTDVIKSELVATEPTLFSTFGKINTTPSTVYDAELTRRIIYVIQIGPHGVVEMSRQIPGLVETSLNFAVLASEKTSFDLF
jgi:dipeptidase D